MKKIISLQENFGQENSSQTRLIDGIGNADQILKQKFGENVIIKKFEKPKGFLAKKLSSSVESQLEKIENILEEKHCGKDLDYKCQKKKTKKRNKYILSRYNNVFTKVLEQIWMCNSPAI